MPDSRFDFGKNSFDILRYVAAVSVMILHYTGYALIYSQQGREFFLVLRKISYFFPGVVILFSISGYLTAASLERSGNRKRFLMKRFIRIYPELWFSTIVNFVVILLLVRSQLDHSITVWLITQIFGIANTPSCLKNFATGSVNGALWTIFTEVQLYIVLAFVYQKIKKYKKKIWILIIAGFAVVNLISDYISRSSSETIGKIIERTFLPYAVWFFIGVGCYVCREDVIPLLKRFFVPLLIAYSITFVLPVEIPGYYSNIAVSILCPLIVIGGSYKFSAERISYDLSYEFFLFHWIILNILIYFDLMNKLPFAVCFVFFFAGTILISWFSQKYVGQKVKLQKTQ